MTITTLDDLTALRDPDLRARQAEEDALTDRRLAVAMQRLGGIQGVEDFLVELDGGRPPLWLRRPASYARRLFAPMPELDEHELARLRVRVDAMVDRTGGPDACHPAQRGVGSHGYASISVSGQEYLLHRVSFFLATGRDPGELTVDHLCHTRDCDPADCPHRGCQNGRHLGLATLVANIMRTRSVGAVNAAKTRCKRGHEFDAENTLVVQSADHAPGRQCRACKSAWYRAQRNGTTVEQELARVGLLLAG